MTKRIAALAVAAAIVLSFAGPQRAAADESYNIARGARLYDKWFSEIDAPKPTTTHAAWSASNTKKSGDVTWRCKSCHGWDLAGKDGAYAKGSYLTGIGGLRALQGADPAKVVAAIKDDTHAMGSVMKEADMHDIALFVTRGQVDMAAHIGPDKKVNGDASRGEPIYNTLCETCHGLEGRDPKPLNDHPLGGLVNDNPWEVMHKILNGQPGKDMPALRALPIEVTLDVMAYMATKLPQK